MSSSNDTTAGADDDLGTTSMSSSNDNLADGAIFFESATISTSNDSSASTDVNLTNETTSFSNGTPANADDTFSNTTTSSSDYITANAGDDAETTMKSSSNGTSSISTKLGGSTSPSDLAFNFFPRLPIELRLKIWRKALPLFARVVEFSTPSITFNDLETSAEVNYGTVALSSPLTLLAVCKEAREELLSFYTQPFGFHNAKKTGRRMEDLHFSLDFDTLYLRSTIISGQWPHTGLYLCLGAIFRGTYDRIVKGRLKHLAFNLIASLAVDPVRNPAGIDGLDELVLVFGEDSVSSNRDKIVGGPIFEDLECGEQQKFLTEYISQWRALKWVPQNFRICHYGWEVL